MRSKPSSVGKGVYKLNEEDLERDCMGKIVALREKGVAGIGDGVEEDHRKARERHPKEAFYFRIVGPCPAGHLPLL